MATQDEYAITRTGRWMGQCRPPMAMPHGTRPGRPKAGAAENIAVPMSSTVALEWANLPHDRGDRPGALEPGMTDSEPAIALWRWQMDHRFTPTR